MHKPVLRKRFRVPIYPCDITLVVIKTPDEFVRSLGAEYPHSSCDEIEGEACCVYMWPSFLIAIKPNAQIWAVTHEIGHVARRILNAIGFKIDSDNDEPLAYLESWITEKVFDILKKHT